MVKSHFLTDPDVHYAVNSCTFTEEHLRRINGAPGSRIGMAQNEGTDATSNKRLIKVKHTNWSLLMLLNPSAKTIKVLPYRGKLWRG